MKRFELTPYPGDWFMEEKPDGEWVRYEGAFEDQTAEVERLREQCNRQEHGFARRESNLQRELADAYTRLAEATALLVDLHAELESRAGSVTRKMWNRLEAYVEDDSRAPAQPAAPEPECPYCVPHLCPEHQPLQPAAPAIVDPLQSFDARVWAREFMRLLNDGTFAKNGGIDEGLMLAWFANALMRGYDEHRWQQEKQPAAPEPSAEADMVSMAHWIREVERRRAAEAKLAAVAEQRDLWAKQCNMTSEREADLLQELAALRRLAFGATQNDDGSYDDAYQTLDAIRALLGTPGETPSDGGGQ